MLDKRLKMQNNMSDKKHKKLKIMLEKRLKK